MTSSLRWRRFQAGAPTTTEFFSPPLPPLLSSPPISFSAMVSGQHSTGVPPSPRTSAKSFCNLLSSNFQPKSPSTFRGEPAICFSKEEISQLAAPLKYTLIGKFNYRRPKMEVIRKFFISLGLKSLKSVGLLHENHIAIFITQEEDYSRLLLRSTWYISGVPMKVLKWSPDFYPNFESPVVPVWVGFPGLPLHYFEKSALFSIASIFGSPLKMDEPTALLSRPTVARVCIEVDVSKPLKHRLWMGDEKEGYWQDVVFENPPLYCGVCKALGHEDKCCFIKNPSLRTDQEKQNKEKEHLAFSVQEKQKRKDIGKHEMVWKNKVKEGFPPEKPDEGEWTVVRRKNCKPDHNTSKPRTSSAVVVKAAAEDRAESILLSTELTVEDDKKKSIPSSDIPDIPEEIVVPPVQKLGQLRLTEETAGVVVPVISKSGFIPLETLQSAVALTPLPDVARIRKKMGIGDEGLAEPVCLQKRNTTDPFSKAQGQTMTVNKSECLQLDYCERNQQTVAFLSKAQNRPPNSNSIEIPPLDCSAENSTMAGRLVNVSKQMPAYLQKAVCEFQDADKATSAAVSTADEASEMLQKEKGKNKIQPLDCSIDSQPSDASATGLSCGILVLGSQVGLGNASGSSNHKAAKGFEFFKGPHPEVFKPTGTVVCGLDQAAGTDFGKHQPGHTSAAGPIRSTHDELDGGLCQIGSPPSSQPNFQPQNLASENSSQEDAENSGSEDSDYFDNYHSDGDFPDDSDWYSDDSESAKFLKGKWRRGYTLRAISRRSLG